MDFLVSPARPSRAERGSGELPIVELFCTAPKTGWSRNAIMKCGFHNNVVLRNKCQLCSSCKQLLYHACYVRPHCYENHTSLSHSLTTRFWVLYRTTLLYIGSSPDPLSAREGLAGETRTSLVDLARTIAAGRYSSSFFARVLHAHACVIIKKLT